MLWEVGKVEKIVRYDFYNQPIYKVILEPAEEPAEESSEESSESSESSIIKPSN